jgi:hypothetical protein
VSEIKELFGSAAESTTSLFKMSIVIRKATSRDRYDKATVATRDPFNDQFDISHVGHKFPRVRQTEWLETRLGRAITRRRQYLRYCREHHEKLSKKPIVREADGGNGNLETERRTAGPDIRDKQTNRDAECHNSVIRPASTLAPTNASTFVPASLDKLAEVSDEDRSQTSYATSIDEGYIDDELKIIQLSEVATGGSPFECPYCWSILHIKKERSWKCVHPKPDSLLDNGMFWLISSKETRS